MVESNLTSNLTKILYLFIVKNPPKQSNFHPLGKFFYYNKIIYLKIFIILEYLSDFFFYKKIKKD